MEVEFYKWEDFTMEKLHEQIQAKCVSIGFQSESVTVRIHGKPGADKERPDYWTVYAVFEKDGQKRTMSRVLKPSDVTQELERSVTTARSMMSSRAPTP
jgi:hypothetical protein